MPARPLFCAFRTGSAALVRRSTTILALVALAACSRDAAVPTAEENAQMDDAANLLDEAPNALDAIDDGELNAADANQSP